MQQVLRGLQLAAWLLALVKWIVLIVIRHPETPRAAVLWAAGGTLCIIIIWAGAASDRKHKGLTLWLGSNVWFDCR